MSFGNSVFPVRYIANVVSNAVNVQSSDSNNTITLTAPDNLASTIEITLPATQASGFLFNDGTGSTNWQTITAGNVVGATGGVTTNSLVKFADTSGNVLGKTSVLINGLDQLVVPSTGKLTTNRIETTDSSTALILSAASLNQDIQLNTSGTGKALYNTVEVLNSLSGTASQITATRNNSSYTLALDSNVSGLNTLSTITNLTTSTVYANVIAARVADIDVLTGVAGTLNLEGGALTKLNCQPGGVIALQQNGTNRIVANSTGAVALTPANNQNVTLTTTGTGKALYNTLEVLNSLSGTGSQIDVTRNDSSYTLGLASDITGINTFTANTIYTTNVYPEADDISVVTTGVGQLVLGSGTGGTTISTATSGQIVLQQNAVNRLAVTSSGAVTITPESGQNSNRSVSGAGNIIDNVTGTGFFSLRNAGVEKLGMDASGRVIVGTQTLTNYIGDSLTVCGTDTSAAPGQLRLSAASGVNPPQLLVGVNTSTGNASIQTVAQGITFNRVLDLQANGGTTRIGTGGMTLSSGVASYSPATFNYYEVGSFTANVTGPFPAAPTITVTFQMVRIGTLVMMTLPGFNSNAVGGTAGPMNFSVDIPTRWIPTDFTTGSTLGNTVNQNIAIYLIYLVVNNARIQGSLRIQTTTGVNPGRFTVVSGVNTNLTVTGTNGLVQQTVSWFRTAGS